MASLSQHLVKMLSLSLHRDFFFAYRLYSSLLRASLVCYFRSPSWGCTVLKKSVTDRLLVTYQPLYYFAVLWGNFSASALSPSL
ncbi:hypothetical protein N7530_010688 [Penicillium desertorum]|uniref:Uncharacterized protein n=1 Tax=Penicillium desertorum TaxID=1303715 RepID=A0A9W9WIH5_9EURO|nr:hypothetical protein N7530_010688 [Penicillium desertorum]